jgi:hypothetical protein
LIKFSKSRKRHQQQQNFMERNKEWVREKQEKEKKAKEGREKLEMEECTFKPKTLGKEFLKKQKERHFRLSMSNRFDMSVMEKGRMRIERNESDETRNSMERVSPKM